MKLKEKSARLLGMLAAPALSLVIALGLFLFLSVISNPTDPRMAKIAREQAELKAAQNRLDETLLDLDDQRRNIDSIRHEIEQTEADSK